MKTANRWGSSTNRHDAPPSSGPMPDGGDHDVALVALEGVDRADPQVERLQLVGGEGGQDRRLDGVGLGPERRDDADARRARAAAGP